jgi:hypothetical protein
MAAKSTFSTVIQAFKVLPVKRTVNPQKSPITIKPPSSGSQKLAKAMKLFSLFYIILLTRMNFRYLATLTV